MSRALGLTLNLRQHLILSRLLGRAGAFDTKLFYTGIRYRYLRSYYLGGGFSVPRRLRVAINHYQALARHFQPGFLSLAQRGLHLWRGEYDGLQVGIELRFPYVFNHDGDLCLILRADGEHVYQMTFSIAPGVVAGAPEGQVLLVSGIQGTPGKIEQIRRVTDTCHNVAPVRMLLMAAEAFGAALGIRAVIGIGQNHMACPKPGECEGFNFDYDGFWMAALDATESRDFYHMPLPFPVKPIESVSAKHRARARQRRAQRDIVRQDIERQMQDNLAPIVRR
jgi:uncharacterized protein VirK/YbjX